MCAVRVHGEYVCVVWASVSHLCGTCVCVCMLHAVRGQRTRLTRVATGFPTASRQGQRGCGGCGGAEGPGGMAGHADNAQTASALPVLRFWASAVFVTHVPKGLAVRKPRFPFAEVKGSF